MTTLIWLLIAWTCLQCARTRRRTAFGWHRGLVVHPTRMGADAGSLSVVETVTAIRTVLETDGVKFTNGDAPGYRKTE
jgi:hypothetical protein